ncbi:uncharacterized protein LOC133819396 isoform X2 [Humulus lupulus]|uniref:uncharacterized protein LOC133819396 isoform X2 n=1 Tax=Humulus lupulus TaxID=3486 RepID=UPI002B4159EB|nr:uncharacterized protein LOC133819396 isoform X2 [Humulus lupulus]
MANSDSSTPLPVSAPLSPKKENIIPVAKKIAELNESRSELLTRIQGLKQDLQSWRSKLDTQVKVYRDELSELKKSLNTEVDQLRTEFQDLRTTLQQQQDDVTTSLRNLGDVSGNVEKAQDAKDKKEENELPKEKDKEVENLTVPPAVEHA